MNRKKVYLSHPIMGLAKDKASEEIMRENCAIAIDFGSFVRGVFPQLDLYIPAEHEQFVHTAWQKKYLTVEQILDIDCEIISRCDGVILFDHQGGLSRGMIVEQKFASEHGKKIALVKTGDTNEVINVLDTFVKELYK